MSSRDVSLEKIKDERRKLSAMYADFFRGLRESSYDGVIVMSFPFWSIQ